MELSLFFQHQYLQLLEGLDQEIAESRYPFNCLTERHVQAIWFEQKYFKNLKTIEDETIEVISPGIWNLEAGPDFRKATLLIGPSKLQGDVEIHLNDESWIYHHHDQDSQYNDVILHLSLWKPKQTQRSILTSQGKSVAQAYLEDCLTISEGRLLQLIDLDLYPYKKFIGSGHCAQTLFCSQSQQKTVEFFKAASEWRLIQKLKQLKMKVEDPKKFFNTGLAMALGYKNNSEAFFELYMLLQKFIELDETELLALGMSWSGFFEDRYQKKWGTSAKYQSLYQLYKHHLTIFSHSISLKLDRIRPLNHPIRRLVYLIKFLKDPLSTHKETFLFRIWNESWNLSHSSQDWRNLFRKLKESFSSYDDLYWNFHYTFEEEAGQTSLPLLGDDIKGEILVNAFLPLLYEKVIQNANFQEVQSFHAFYETLSSSRKGKTDYLIHRFFGDHSDGQLLYETRLEQGAYQLHKDFCSRYEPSCEGCDFVKRYKKTFTRHSL